MVPCPACAALNDEFATVCVNCRAFLQNRVPNLNFFDTTWGILESPRRTFRTIAIAEHKNYALFLFAAFGVALAFTAAWYLRLGRFFETLLDLIPMTIAAGTIAGLVLALVLPLVHRVVTKYLGGTAHVRQSLGVLAYACVPVVLSLIIVLPIELLTFGMYLFTSNPHPAVIKPVSYYALVAFDTILGFWTLLLAVVGTRVVHRISGVRSIVAVIVVLIAVIGVFAAGGWSAALILGGAS